jgi:large subunit ribosomal protein L9
MKIILSQKVDSLGNAGDIVTVKDGYGRNYLIPKGLASVATKKNIAAMETLIEQQKTKEAKTRANLESLADRLNSLTLKFSLKAGEDDKLFGSVTSQMISEAIIDKGYSVEKREIEMEESINHVGNHFVNIKLGHGFSGRVKIKVAAE